MSWWPKQMARMRCLRSEAAVRLSLSFMIHPSWAKESAALPVITRPCSGTWASM